MFSVLFIFLLLFEVIENQVLNNGLQRYRISSKKEDSFKQINNYHDFHNVIRIAIKDVDKKWLNKRIPYIISDTFLAQNKALIERAIHGFQNTCIKFEPKKPIDIDYIVLTGGEGCNSPVGRQRGLQNVTLGVGCLYFNTIIHELMHSIGFFHEHQRYDRDNHIIIHQENIRRGMEFEFIKRPKNETTDIDFQYDYNSVMQYEETAFSKNGRPTMESKVKGIKLGPINGLSETDIRRINKYYECDDQNQLQNEETVKTSDPKSDCLDLKWKSFHQNIGLSLMVFGGNDSFGNRFYVCRTSVDNQLIVGQLFEGMCYVVKSGRELEVQDFQVLTHSTNGYKWQLFTSNRLPSDVVITGNGLTSDESGENDSIGRCSLKYWNYRCLSVGTIRPNEQSIRQLSVAFNGIEIKCNEFQILLCRTSKGHQKDIKTKNI